MTRNEMIEKLSAITMLEAEDVTDLNDIQLESLLLEELDVFNRLDPWAYGV